MAGNFAFLTSQPENPTEQANFKAKHVLEGIILKLAEKDTEEIKSDFLALPLQEQKRTLRVHGLSQGIFSKGFHSIQKRLGYRSNNNSRKSENFVEAQQRYFKQITQERYDVIKSKLPEKIKIIIDFFDMFVSRRMADNPKKDILTWLEDMKEQGMFNGNREEVFVWAMSEAEKLPYRGETYGERFYGIHHDKRPWTAADSARAADPSYGRRGGSRRKSLRKKRGRKARRTRRH